MVRNSLTLALATAAVVLTPMAARANDSFLSRSFTAPHDSGRWVNRRLTVRHHGQDNPTFAMVFSGNTFVGRWFTEPHERGRWVNRRLTVRHHDQDCD